LEESGGKWRNFDIYLHSKKTQVSATNLIGEFECRLDDKSRIILPSALKKQISPEAHDKFVINRGFEGCLVLYPQNVWDETTARMNKLNLFVKDHRQFVRAFNNGATPLILDSQNRLLLPKPLLDYAAIDREIILFAYSDRIEVWNKKTYLELVSGEPADFAQLAEKVMGNPTISSTGDDIS
jgi:MraZ protein